MEQYLTVEMFKFYACVVVGLVFVCKLASQKSDDSEELLLTRMAAQETARNSRR
jgi:hypothetical protein